MQAKGPGEQTCENRVLVWSRSEQQAVQMLTRMLTLFRLTLFRLTLLRLMLSRLILFRRTLTQLFIPSDSLGRRGRSCSPAGKGKISHLQSASVSPNLAFPQPGSRHHVTGIYHVVEWCRWGWGEEGLIWRKPTVKTDGNSERAGPPLAFSVPVLMDSSRDVRTHAHSHAHAHTRTE